MILGGEDHVREGVPAVTIDPDADRRAVGLVAAKEDGLRLWAWRGLATHALLDVEINGPYRCDGE